MTIEEALTALGNRGDADFPVIILRNVRGELTAAPVLGVAVDDTNEDASLLMGDFSDEDEALDDAIPMSEVREALEELVPDRAGWPLFSASAGAISEDQEELGGALVGVSCSEELELFAFLQGPKEDWDDE
jgi:hypothetical protein